MTVTGRNKCGILGVTGSVGQQFTLLLANHPLLHLHRVGASERSAGKIFKSCAKWKQILPIPDEFQNLVIQACKPENFKDCDLVFSALDSDIAYELEMEFVKAGLPVFSNAKSYRMHPLVPLVVPLVNPAHLSLINFQREKLGLKKGFLVCNSNCAVVGVVVPLAALQAKFGPIAECEVFTAQAVSGAGYPGPSSIELLDNVIPFISGEEEKLEIEAQKILGCLNSSASAVDAQCDLRIGATCTRVGVTDGHMAYVSLRFKNHPGPSVGQVKEAMVEYQPDLHQSGISFSGPAIKVFTEDDRPQPRLDRKISNGYTVSVGRVRQGEKDDHFHIRFVALSHNTVIGAAGSSILSSEAAIIKGLI